MGRGNISMNIKYDGKLLPSAVIPAKTIFNKIEITLGEPKSPYVKSTNSILAELFI